MKKTLKIGLILLNIVILIKLSQVTNFFQTSRRMADFDVYYRTVVDMRNGTNPYLISYMQNLGPPITFAYFIPYSFFNLNSAQIIFILFNTICGYGMARTLAYKYFVSNKIIGTLLISALLYLSFLSRYSLQIGQPTLTLAWLISLAVVSQFSGFWLGLVTIIKAFLGYGLISLVHKPSQLLTSFMVGSVLIIVCLPIIRPEYYQFYFSNRFFISVSPQVDKTLLNYENQNLKATLTRVGLDNWFGIVWVALILSGGYLLVKTGDVDLGIIFSFLVSPVVWQHYLIALLPLFVKFYFEADKRVIKWLAVAFVLWWPDLRLTSYSPTLIRGIIASHFYFSIVILAVARLLIIRRLRLVGDSKVGRRVGWNNGFGYK